MLIFTFGAMNSGKSAYALMTLHQRHRPHAPAHRATALLATTLDRSETTVTSRTGMTGPALQLVPGEVTAAQFPPSDTVVIDEAQFLTPADVEQLALLSNGGTEVICFGLRTDFTGHLFPGSKRLMELADAVHQLTLEPLCATCDRIAVINARLVGEVLTTDGPQVALDSIDSRSPTEVSYAPMCVRCWWRASRRY